MSEVSSVLNEYDDIISKRMASFVHVTNTDHILYGISSLDNLINMRPGCTMVYAYSDIGKTSIAKTIAIAGKRQGLNVMYYDVENKLSLHDSERMKGIGHVTASRKSGLQQIIRQGVVDLLIVDTITGIPDMSQDLFLAKVRPYVPYILITAQVRQPYYEPKGVPAVHPKIMSASNTVIFLESKETITIESEDFLRVQFKIEKYEADVSFKGERSSFIIRNNFVDNLYSAYDYIRSTGIVTTIGRRKILNDGKHEFTFDSMKSAVKDPGITNAIMSAYYDSIGIICNDREVYLE